MCLFKSSFLFYIISSDMLWVLLCFLFLFLNLHLVYNLLWLEVKDLEGLSFEKYCCTFSCLLLLQSSNNKENCQRSNNYYKWKTGWNNLIGTSSYKKKTGKGSFSTRLKLLFHFNGLLTIIIMLAIWILLSFSLIA